MILRGLAFSVLTMASGAMAFDRMLVFGDSLSDVGNVLALTGGFVPPSPPYAPGRFSNGLLWVEYLADDLGIARPTASAGGGSNFAYGGSETGTGTVPPGLRNLRLQVEDFALSGIDGSNSIATVFSGSNDFIGSPGRDATAAAANVGMAINRLADLCVRDVIVPNLPPLGFIPHAQTPSDRAALNAAADAFNAALVAELNALSSRSDVTVYRVDTTALFADIIAYPAAFGFTNVVDSAVDTTTGAVAPGSDRYLFFDPLHPTTRAHALLADRALQAIPEPATALWLLLPAVMLRRVSR